MNDSSIIEKKTLGQWIKEHQSGLYLTMIFHLIILILLTIQGIQGQLKNESVFIFDFSREEAEQAKREEEIRKQQEKEEIEQEVEEMIRRALSSQTPRNVAVNTADRRQQPDVQSTLGESKSLFDEAKSLQERLDNTRQQILEMQGSDELAALTIGNEDKEENKETYQGPSVLSYTLDGRRAVFLPIPVYKCEGGGDVIVIIDVNRNGYVVGASINKHESTDNDCLHQAAMDAARRSRFNESSTSPERQKGEIAYRFIAQ